MNRIPEDAYKQYIEWAAASRSNQVYPLSIAEGFQSGEIYTDRAEMPETVLFRHYCGFAYLSGKPGDAFLNELYETFFLKDQGRRFFLITNDNTVVDFFSGKPVINISKRIEYRYEEKQSGTLADPENPDLHIERISERSLAGIEGRIIPSFSWDSGQRFLKNGFGYVVMENNEAAAVAFSAALSCAEVDIGVETKERYRGRGYAHALTEKMCQTIRMQGKVPVWAHAQQNTASMNTALGCGFRQKQINYMIRGSEQ